MHPLVAFSLIGLAFLVGAAVGWSLFRPTSRTGISFRKYFCDTKTMQITLTSTMQLYIDALDDTAGSATQPDFPGPNAIKVPNASGTMIVGPLVHENGAEKVLICVWAIEKVDTWPRDCSGSGSGSGSGHIIKKIGAKRSVLP